MTLLVDDFAWLWTVPLAGAIVGILWIRRITGGYPDSERSFWRYREPTLRPAAEPGGRKGPTWGWIATRLQMAVAHAALVVAVGVLMIQPQVFEPTFAGAQYGILVYSMGIAGLLIGNVWILTIAHRMPDRGGSSWRYRRSHEAQVRATLRS